MGMRAGGTPRPGNAGALVASRTAYIAATLGTAGSYTVPQVDGSGVFPWNFESEKSDITHAAGSSIFTIVQAGLYHVGGAQFVRFAVGDRFRFSVTGPVSTGGIVVNVDAGANGEGPNAWMFAYRVY